MAETIPIPKKVEFDEYYLNSIGISFFTQPEGCDYR